MKTLPIILGVSLLANVALLVIFVSGAFAPSAPTATRSASQAAAAPAPVPAAAAGDTWAELRTDDPRAQAEKLRADGFPPNLVRAIISAQIRAGFSARRKELEAAQADRPFWRAMASDPKFQAAQIALSREEQKAIKDVLGPDPENGTHASLRRQFPQFSEETIEQIVAIRERYDQQRMELYGNRGPGPMLPDEMARVQAMEKALRGEIATVLTPAQLEEYELRTSNTANSLRYSLAAFEPTEQEFRSMFKLQSAFDEQYRMYGASSEEQMRARTEAHKQLQEQIKGALGLERYAEYQRATDHDYRQTRQLVARLELPPDTANQLYAVKKEFEQRRNDMYRAGGATGPSGFAAVTEQAAALQREAIARVAPILGSPSRVDAYKQYGGSWITNMVPRPPPRPAPKS